MSVHVCVCVYICVYLCKHGGSSNRGLVHQRAPQSERKAETSGAGHWAVEVGFRPIQKCLLT